MRSFLQDVRFALRVFAKSPGFTATAIITLALGIGANTAVFTVMRGLFYRPLPVAEPARVYSVLATDNETVESQFSYPVFGELRRRCNVFSDLSAWYSQPVHVGIPEQAERSQAGIVSGTYFSMLGVSPEIGRLFTEDDDVIPGGHPVVVVSYDMWQAHFGGDPGILGNDILLNGRIFAIVGVAARGFCGTTLGRPNELWVPTAMYDVIVPQWAWVDALHSAGFMTFQVMGRLAPSMTVEHARTQLTSVCQELQTEGLSNFPAGRLVPLAESTMGASGRADAIGYMRLVVATVGLVLLIAGANVGNMLMARTQDRRKELAVRRALGAGRWRMVRLLVTESVLLAIVGGGLGLLISTWVTDILLLLVPEGESLSHASIDLTLDAHIYAFTLGIAVLAGIALGLGPALQAAGLNLIPAIKGESGMSKHSWRWLNFSNLLVTSQVAVSLLLLASAGLLVQTFTNLRGVDPGFATDNLLLASFNLRRQSYDLPARQTFHERLLQRAGSLPGVVSVALAGAVPPHNRRSLDLRLEGHQSDSAPTATVACNIVSPTYFAAMRIPLVRGRVFDDQDTDSAPGVVVINATMARRYWGDSDSALGRLVHLGRRTLEVVGVIEDAKYHSLREEPQPFAFFSISQMDKFTSTITLVARTERDPISHISAIRAVVTELDPALPLFDVQTLDEHLGTAMSQERMLAWLSGVFSILAFVLTATGLFGVMSYAVTRRTREIGIRRAMGAQTSSVVCMILRHASSVTLVGITAGLAGTAATTQMLKTRLYGVPPTDIGTFVGAAFVLVIAALAACYIPARRATKVDPIVALRHE